MTHKGDRSAMSQAAIGFAAALAFIAVTAVPATAQPADSLDLAGWLARARAQSPALAAAAASVREAEGLRGVAISHRGPRLETGALYVRFEDPPAIALGAGGSFAPLSQNTYLARLSVTQPLYTGGRLSATVQAAEWGVRSVALSLLGTEVELTAAVAQAYHDVLLARALRAVAGRSVEVLEEAARVAEQHFEAGTAGRLDMLRAQTRLSSAWSARRASETAIVTMQERLAAIAGIHPDSAPLAIGSLEYAETAIDPGALVERVRSTRPDLRALRAAAGAERAQASAAAAGRRPVVSLSATGIGAYPEILTGRDRWSWTLLAAVNVSWPFFDSGESAARARTAQAAAERAEAQAAQTEDAAVAAIRAAIRELQRAAEDVEAGRENAERAERALGIAQARYVEGMGIQLDVLEAEADLTRAAGDSLRAIHAYRSALVELRRAAGLPADAPLTNPSRGGDNEGGES